MRSDSSQLNPRATGSKSRTCAAIFVLNIETSNSVTRLTAETPLIIFFQQASFPIPLGDIIPTPVTTTLLCLFMLHPLLLAFRYLYKKTNIKKGSDKILLHTMHWKLLPIFSTTNLLTQNYPHYQYSRVT